MVVLVGVGVVDETTMVVFPGEDGEVPGCASLLRGGDVARVIMDGGGCCLPVVATLRLAWIPEVVDSAMVLIVSSGSSRRRLPLRGDEGMVAKKYAVAFALQDCKKMREIGSLVRARAFGDFGRAYLTLYFYTSILLRDIYPLNG